jgi:hypothetical protein
MTTVDDEAKIVWIVDEGTHHRVCEILADPDRRPAGLTNVRRYLLSGGLLVCGKVLGKTDDQQDVVCGKPPYAQPSNSISVATYAARVRRPTAAADTGFDTHVWQLAWTLTTYLYRLGHYRQDMAETQLAAIQTPERLKDRARHAD